MSLKMRLARGGAKKRPYYRIVVAAAQSPRDGNFIEKLGTYNPFLSHDNPDRVRLFEERIRYWLGVGAQPTERVRGFLSKKELITPQPASHNPLKAKPRKKALERLKAAAETQ